MDIVFGIIGAIIDILVLILGFKGGMLFIGVSICILIFVGIYKLCSFEFEVEDI